MIRWSLSAGTRSALLALSVLLAASQLRAEQDAPGAADPPGVARYPGAWIAFGKPLGAPRDVRVPVDRIARSEDLGRPDTLRSVRGRVRSVTWAQPRGVSAKAVFEHLRGQLPDLAWFECAGLQCGASTYWAYSVFDVADLYGRNGDQYYAAVPRTTPDGPEVVLLYVVRRGTGEVFAHFEEVLLSTSVAAAAPAADPQRLARTLDAELRERGAARVPGQPFTADGSIAPGAAPLMSALATLVRDQPPGRRLWIVVHMAGSVAGSVEASLGASQARAEALRAALEEAVPGARLGARGVGALVPSVLGEAKIRVELVRD